VKLLLDTHTLIWALSEPEKLPPKITKLLTDVNNIIFASVVSLWELQIKKSLGKIILPDAFALQLQECGYELLNVTPEHILKLENIPLLHRYPFDRMLIAQSLFEKMPLVTKDSEILRYDLEFIKF
jgi:PIN domain nuclease of toxin-antitoxin system